MKQKNKPLGQYHQRTDCRFCQGKNLVKVLDFGLVPLAGGFLKREQFSEEKFYPLELNFCQDCTLVQVNNVVPAEVLFKNYFYFSSSIKTLVEHLTLFAQETNQRFLQGRSHPAVFEIGCNDGVLLKPFAAMGIKAVGVDPATNVVSSIDTKEIIVINDFFSEKCAQQVKNQQGLFDAIVSSYSFAHIDDMVSIMKGVKILLKEDGVFIFEVYYLGTLIDEMQYDMIYHEHLSYYSLKALKIFLERFGMEIFDVKFIPGVRSGAARFYAQNIGRKKEKITASIKDLEAAEQKKCFDKIEVYLQYAQKVNGTRERLLALLNRLKAENKTIIGYGASGRGTTIMNYCGIDGRYLDYVVDDAPAKHGFFTPGTHVPIKPWDFTKQTKFPEYALLFAWSFIDEVKKRRADYLKEGGHFIVPLPEVQVTPPAKTKVLVLGATGMLGYMVWHFLKNYSNFEVVGTSRKARDEFIYFDVYEDLERFFASFGPVDYVINCIGVTKPYCHDDNMEEVRNAIFINSFFPHQLFRLGAKRGFKVIQIATDCVFSGREGKYVEESPHEPLDVYGKTKSLGEVRAPSFLNVRCSIIGLEKFHKAFLLEWFLQHPDGGTVKGFSHHFWNGVTTLQFAKCCKAIIEQEKLESLTKQSAVHHFVPNNIVTKHELLCLFKEVFRKNIQIQEERGQGQVVDRTLSSHFQTLNVLYPQQTMKEALIDLRNYSEKENF